MTLLNSSDKILELSTTRLCQELKRARYDIKNDPAIGERALVGSLLSGETLGLMSWAQTLRTKNPALVTAAKFGREFFLSVIDENETIHYGLTPEWVERPEDKSSDFFFSKPLTKSECIALIDSQSVREKIWSELTEAIAHHIGLHLVDEDTIDSADLVYEDVVAMGKKIFHPLDVRSGILEMNDETFKDYGIGSYVTASVQNICTEEASEVVIPEPLKKYVDFFRDPNPRHPARAERYAFRIVPTQDVVPASSHGEASTRFLELLKEASTSIVDTQAAVTEVFKLSIFVLNHRPNSFHDLTKNNPGFSETIWTTFLGHFYSIMIFRDLNWSDEQLSSLLAFSIADLYYEEALYEALFKNDCGSLPARFTKGLRQFFISTLNGVH